MPQPPAHHPAHLIHGSGRMAVALKRQTFEVLGQPKLEAQHLQVQVGRAQQRRPVARVLGPQQRVQHPAHQIVQALAHREPMAAGKAGDALRTPDQQLIGRVDHEEFRGGLRHPPSIREKCRVEILASGGRQPPDASCNRRLLEDSWRAGGVRPLMLPAIADRMKNQGADAPRSPPRVAFVRYTLPRGPTQRLPSEGKRKRSPRIGAPYDPHKAIGCASRSRQSGCAPSSPLAPLVPKLCLGTPAAKLRFASGP